MGDGSSGEIVIPYGHTGPGISPKIDLRKQCAYCRKFRPADQGQCPGCGAELTIPPRFGLTIRELEERLLLFRSTGPYLQLPALPKRSPLSRFISLVGSKL